MSMCTWSVMISISMMSTEIFAAYSKRSSFNLVSIPFVKILHLLLMTPNNRVFTRIDYIVIGFICNIHMCNYMPFLNLIQGYFVPSSITFINSMEVSYIPIAKASGFYDTLDNPTLPPDLHHRYQLFSEFSHRCLNNY